MDYKEYHENESFLMYDCSFKKMKDLKPGDVLMGDDSQPCTIQNIELVNEENNYLVKPIKGDSYIVGESHNLAINISGALQIGEEKGVFSVKWFDKEDFKFHSKRFNPIKYENSKEKAYEAARELMNKIKTEKRFLISVKKYTEAIKSTKHVIKGYRVPLEFPDIEVKIDPYIVGAWLGDGTTRDPAITNIDKEIIEYFENYFSQFNLVLKPMKHKEITYGISSIKDGKGGGKGDNIFLTFLKESNLKNNKHIPLIYLKTSREKRLKLLAGLLDTDGSLSNGCFDFVQKKEKLFDDFLFLSRSLGFSCYKTKERKICTNSPNGMTTGEYFRCAVSGKGLEDIPILVERKKAKPREQVKDNLVTGIKLEKINLFPVYRITTDKPRFLMSDFTVRQSYELEDI
jgi:hypothetical protein